jgi:DDE superfamily endonuclease
MAHDLLRTLLEYLEVLRPALTRPGFDNLLVLFTGWVLTTGPHAVTQALVVTSVAGRRHHEAFHRFFSRGTWDPDEMGRLLLGCILALLPDQAPLRLAVDDTLAPKKGPQVFGIGSHLDAVRSTRLFRIFSFGHCWVMLAVLMPMPFSKRTWALPVLFRLYRSKKTCDLRRRTYRKKTELAREMMDVLLGWVGPRRVELAADAAYCNDTVTRDLPAWVVLLGAMRPDAVLTAPPPSPGSGKKGGRPRKRGEVLQKPKALAKDDQHPWKTCRATLYGRRTQVRYKDCYAQWYRACGTRLLHIVVVQVQQGTLGMRVFFSTDASLSVCQILEGYAGRWAIEVCFRDLKQLMGFADSCARKQQAVERTAPLTGFIYTLLVLWFADKAHCSLLATPPLRPWYPHKQGLCFADILRTAQRVLGPLDVLDPRRSLANLQKPSPPASRPVGHRCRPAA